MKTFSITMEVTVSVTVEAETQAQAEEIARCLPDSEQSEFARRVVGMEDITPKSATIRKGVGSY